MSGNIREIKRMVTPVARYLKSSGVSCVISGPHGQKYKLPTQFMPSSRINENVIKDFGYRTSTIESAIRKVEHLNKFGAIKSGQTVDLADVILGKYDRVTVNIGAYCGQEGKGKISDWLAQEKIDIVIRYQGGDNCCYQTIFNGMDMTLTLLPVGVLSPNITSILGNATYIPPEIFLKEVGMVEKALGRSLSGKIIVSGRANVVMPYHTMLRTYEERARDLNALGGCNTGVGLAASDKYGRKGISVNDLFKPAELRKKLEEFVPRYNDEIAGVIRRAGKEGIKLPEIKFSVDELYEKCLAWAEKMHPYVTAGVTGLVNDAIADGERILCQGVQAALVDIDNGGYPNCTSSNTLTGGVSTALGIDPALIENKVGTVKVYGTRSHAGVFPTEIFENSEDAYDREAFIHILEKGKEFEHVFGEGGMGGVALPIDKNVKNRIGWMDLVFLKYSAQINGLTQLAITKLDVLTGLPKIKVCTGYVYRGEVFDSMPENPKILKNIQHVYEELPGWFEDITNVRSFEGLPVNAQNFLKTVSRMLNVRVGILSVGPKRDQTFYVAPYHFDQLLK